MPPGTREGDDTNLAARFTAVRREGRKRTIVYSVIASGLVSLFIGRAIEVQGYNDQVDRSRKNCQAIQQDRRLDIATLQRQVDQTFGNPKKGIPPFDFKGSGFAKFEPLVRAQARKAALDAEAKRSRLENCDKVFPHRSLILFFGG